MKKPFRILISIITVIVLVMVIVVGFNIYKNRWHKLDFNIDSVTVRAAESVESPETQKYTVYIKGTAKTWFYDFNTYKFDLTQASDAKKSPIRVIKSDTLIVSHNKETEFEYVVETNDYNDVFDYVMRGENTMVGDRSRREIDIRLFMSEYNKDEVLKILE